MVFVVGQADHDNTIIIFSEIHMIYKGELPLRPYLILYPELLGEWL